MTMQKHLVGLSSFTFPASMGALPGQKPDHRMTAMELVEKTANLGADYLQFGDNLPLNELTEEELLQVKELAAEKGLPLETGMRGIQIEHVSRFIEITHTLGASLLRCITDGRNGSYEPDLPEIIANIRAVLPLLQKYDIILGLENHDRLYAQDYVDIVKAVDDPHVGLIVDTTNSLSTEEATAYVLETMCPYCVNLHFKDYKIHRVPGGMGLIITGECTGRGRQDVAACIETALRLAPGPFNITLEHWMEPCETLEESLDQETEWALEGLAYIRKVLGSR